MSEDPNISALFSKIISALGGVDSKTSAILESAEERYVNVSGMSSLNPEAGGKGYSTGGAAERIALYTHLDWKTIDGKLADVVSAIHSNMHGLIESLKSDTDPDSVRILHELEEHADLHLIKNACYHSYWLGYFTNEVGIESGEIIPADSLPKEPKIFNAEEVLDVAIEVTAKTSIEIDQAMKAAGLNEDELGDEYILTGLGITMEALRLVQKRMGNATKKSLEDNPELGDTDSNEINIYGMNAALGILIGRELERRSRL